MKSAARKAGGEGRGEEALEAFFERLKKSPLSVLLLDYDGTLAPFCVDRDRAVPYKGVRELLACILEDSSTHLAIVTGRRAGDISPLLGLPRVVEVWGSHGFERLRAVGGLETFKLSAPVREALKEAERWASGKRLGSHLEEKPASLAFHWRGLPEEEQGTLRERVSEGWEPLVRPGEMALKEFDGGLELRALGRDKGSVVRDVMGEMPEGAALAYLGDDWTDEDAFAAIPEDALGVLVRGEFRDTRAGAWIRPPEELLAFLERWLKARGRRG